MLACATPTHNNLSSGPFYDNKIFYEFIEISTMATELEHSNSYEDSLQKFIGDKIAEVNEVEYIYCQREERAYFVWILINQLNSEVRDQIYTKQLEIIDKFLDELFDFYIVARMGKPADTIVSGAELIYQKS